MKIPPKVSFICETLRARGFEAWIVGGAVRDHILQRPVHDWDLATNATPDQIQQCFARTLDIGARHGTITVCLDDEMFEVTTYRKDGAYSDGRHPDDVQFTTSLKDDLSRRDFTVNAIAFNPLEEVYYDPFNGQTDLQNGVLRTVGSPIDRFSEDGLRLLRAARFTAKLNLVCDFNTFNALSVTVDRINKVSVERIRDELLKILVTEEPSRAFNLMAATGMLSTVLPEMLPMVGCSQNRYHEFDVWKHTLLVVDSCPADDPLLRFAALCHDIGKPSTKKPHPQHGDATFYDHEVVGAAMTRALMTRLHFSREESDRVSHLVLHHFVRYESSWSAAAVRRWIRKVRPENVDDLISLSMADISGKGNAYVSLEVSAMQELRQRVEAVGTIPTEVNMLTVSGHDVMETLGIPPGPRVGKILNELLERVTDNPSLNSRENLMSLIPEVANAV